VPGESARVENYIRWSDNFEQETGYNSQTTLAVTIRFSQIPLIRRTEIVLNRGHIFLKNNQFLRVVLLHEMGHTIGLDHSEYYEAIMYSNLKFEQPENQVLHEDDVNGLRASIDLNLNRQSQNVGIEALSGKNDESSNAFSCGTIDVNGSNGGGPLLPNFIALIFGLLLSFVLKYKRGRFV
jgi:hypothetical protein